MSTSFKDLFSTQSKDYALYRPKYPPALFKYLAELSPSNETAWDCGTGTAQAALELANHFRRVIATDPSEAQLVKAKKHARIEYRVSKAEESGITTRTVDLVTAAQAFHWFKEEEFYNECKRVLMPGGHIAIWCYGLTQITPQIDAAVFELYENILGEYWEPERLKVEEGYRSATLPGTEIPARSFEMKADWSFTHLVGYLNTWSALQTFISKHDKNPLESMIPKLQEAWGSAPTRPVTWKLALRICRP